MKKKMVIFGLSGKGYRINVKTKIKIKIKKIVVVIKQLFFILLGGWTGMMMYDVYLTGIMMYDV